MKQLKKILCLLLILAVFCGTAPLLAQAQEQQLDGKIYAGASDAKTYVKTNGTYGAEEPEGDGAYSIPTQVNPLYRDQLDPDDIVFSRESGDRGEFQPQAEEYLSLGEAADVIRQGMKARQETIDVAFVSGSFSYQDAADELLVLAMAHTGNPLEGDYLMWQYAAWQGEMDRETADGNYLFTCRFYFAYYTTAEQEAELTAAVNQLMSRLALQGKSDYEKIYAVYDYICRNVTYDYEHLNDESYTLQFTAYAALMNKTAVCQGYALLFYRIMLEQGIDCRLIAGDGGGPHGWNIVQLDGLYYNVDSTWDAGIPAVRWNYFLNSYWDFLDHERYMEYDTIAFHNQYPLAEESYVPGVPGTVDPVINAGYCGEDASVDYSNAIWYVCRDGSVCIAGEGEMKNYTTASNRRPYYEYWIDEITRVVVGESVTTVGEYAFYEFPMVQEVEIGPSVEIIGSYAFYQCGELKNVALQEGLHTISRFAFCSCSNLEQINFPSTLKVIRDSAFQYDWNLVISDLGDSLETLGGNAFNGCEAIPHITLPGSLKDIGSSVFYGCQGLETVTFGEGSTLVGDNMFTFCHKLSQVNLPDSMEIIGRNAFQGCDALYQIELPEGLSEIRSGAFQGSSLNHIDIPGSITVIADEVFQGCHNLHEITLPQGITTIGEASFSNCPLEQIEIPAGVTTIQSRAFALTQITSVVIPEGVKRIENFAFTDCENLTQVTLPDSLEYLSGFSRCPQLRQMELPENLLEIGTSAFQGSAALASINIPDSVAVIGDSAFSGCSSLKELDLPQSLTTIGGTAFLGCTGLKKITIPAAVTRIGSSAFIRCSGLREIEFLGDAPDVHGSAFAGVTATAYYPAGNATWTEDKLQNYGGNLTWVPQGGEVPPAENKCGDNAYWSYENGTLTISGQGEMYNYYTDPAPWADFANEITDLVVGEGITVIGEAAFTGLDNLKNVSMADSVAYIDHFAFMFCESLETIDLPDHLTGIGQQAFWCCRSLESVVIPDSVTWVDSGAFEECTALTDVLFLSDPDIPSFGMGNSVFRNCTALEEIRVEEGHIALRSIDGALYIRVDDVHMLLNDYPIGKKDTHFRVADNTVIISQMAFWNACALEEIVVPATVAEMGTYVFSGCDALDVIHFEGDMPNMTTQLFRNLNVTITYPCNASGWDNRAAWETEDMVGPDGSITWEISHEFADGSCIHCGEVEEGADHVPGDITGDGVVNNKDLTRLFRYLSGFQVEVNEAALDITGDGAVNNKDVTRLFRYLSGFDVEIF